MSKEKQMLEDLIEIFDEEYERRRLITPQNTAEKMTAKGYRKQSEGEWIWTVNGTEDYEMYYVCSVCKEHDFVKSKFCPECGAKMSRKEDEGEMKICELKIKDMASVNSITQALLLNGYEVQSAVMWKEFPLTGIDCFMIAIFDHPTEKGGVQ